MSFISLTQTLTSAQQTEFLNVMIQSLTRSQLLAVKSLNIQPGIADICQFFTEQELQYIVDGIKAKCNYNFDGSEIDDDYEW